MKHQQNRQIFIWTDQKSEDSNYEYWKVCERTINIREIMITTPWTTVTPRWNGQIYRKIQRQNWLFGGYTPQLQGGPTKLSQTQKNRKAGNMS